MSTEAFILASRCLFTAVLLVFVFTETGWATTVVLFLITIRCELQDYLKKRGSEEKDAPGEKGE